MFCEDDGRLKKRYMPLVYDAWDETEKELRKGEANV
jgi:hypothetical protein